MIAVPCPIIATGLTQLLHNLERSHDVPPSEPMRVLPEEPNLKSEKRVRSSNGSLKGSHGYKRESARGGIQIRTAASSLIALRLFVKTLRKMRPKKESSRCTVRTLEYLPKYIYVAFISKFVSFLKEIVLNTVLK